MSKPKKEIPRICDRISYDLEGWEGGVAVYWMDGDHGTTIVAVPRLGLSTCLLGNPSDRVQLLRMLLENHTMSSCRDQTENLSDLILRDIKGLKLVFKGM